MTTVEQRWAAAAAAGRAAGQRLVVGGLANRGAVAGQRLGTGAGDSVEFMEHRAYEPGDDLRRIDWNVYARTDQLTVRRYRAEISPNIDIIIDASKSMDLDDTPKADTAVAVAAACAEAAARSGLRPRLMTSSDRAAQLPGAPASFAKARFDSARNTAPDVRAVGAHRPSARFLITDLMFAAEPRGLLLQLIGAGAFAGVVCILTDRERSPEALRGRRLIDRETGERSNLEVSDAVLAEYRERLKRHLASWSAAARALGAAFVELTAEDALADATLAITPLVRAGLLEARP